MTDMIAAEPALAERLAARFGSDPVIQRLAAAVRSAADAGAPILTTGCGTSEHAAMVIAGLLQAALRDAGARDPWVASVQAFELAGQPPPRGLVLAVSHEGGTWATNEALRLRLRPGRRRRW